MDGALASETWMHLPDGLTRRKAATSNAKPILILAFMVAYRSPVYVHATGQPLLIPTACRIPRL